MATTLSYDLTYDAPVAEVSEMLMDPAFRERVCEAQGAIRTDVSITGDDGDRTVVVDQVWRTDGIPSFAKKFVGSEMNLVQTEHWKSADHATLEVAIPGKPGHVTGTITLVESGGTTTETVAMEVKVGVPLVGGKIEGLVADLLRKALKTENAVGREHVGG